MELIPQPKDYPVRRRQGINSPGCGTVQSHANSGLCPILVDDVLSGSDLIHDGRPCAFRIIGNLGLGSNSTVWLGKEITSGQYLALKVLRLEHDTPEHSEMGILQKLGKLKTAFYHTHISTQDRFLCLGLLPLGCTLSERFDSEVHAPWDIPSLTILAKTLLMKVLDFHQKQVCHGDISPDNVCLGLHSGAFTNEALHKTFEYRTPLKTNAEDMSLVDIIGFGKAFETPSKKYLLEAKEYIAPELDGDGATVKSDLWSLGCLFAYAPTYVDLFYMRVDRPYYIAADHEAQLSFIESQVSMPFLKENPECLRLFVRLIHSLVRVDPEERDPEEAMRILGQLEAWETLSVG